MDSITSSLLTECKVGWFLWPPLLGGTAWSCHEGGPMGFVVGKPTRSPSTFPLHLPLLLPALRELWDAKIGHWANVMKSSFYSNWDQLTEEAATAVKIVPISFAQLAGCDHRI